MPSLPFYSRHRLITVELADGTTMRSSCRLEDTLTSAFVQVTARLPDLEIIQIEAHMSRSLHQECLRPPDSLLQRMVGTRIGPGISKMIRGLIGEETSCPEYAFMVEECCHGVILSFTKEVLQKAPKEEARTKDYYKSMVRENIRLYNRCAAFAPGSPLVEGIEPAK